MGLTKFDWIVFVIIIVILILVIRAELQDTLCGDIDRNECGIGKGRVYFPFKPEEDDDCDTLLDKIKQTARYEINSIHWRRSAIAAAIISFISLYVLEQKIPSAIRFLTILVIAFIIIYIMLAMFQRTTSVPAVDQVDDLVNIVRQDCM